MELALGYRIFQENYKFTAENYQIMNYGFGGSISVHLDANNDVSDNDISNEETDIIEIKPSIIFQVEEELPLPCSTCQMFYQEVSQFFQNLDFSSNQRLVACCTGN